MAIVLYTRNSMKNMIGAVIAITLMSFALSNAHSISKVTLANASVLTGISAAHVVAIPAKPVVVQDPAQDPEGSKRCERPNPNNPDVGDKDSNKIGCTCMRKCVAGKPSENYEEGKGCKVHCKPDQCDCPNPCKT